MINDNNLSSLGDSIINEDNLKEFAINFEKNRPSDPTSFREINEIQNYNEELPSKQKNDLADEELGRKHIAFNISDKNLKEPSRLKTIYFSEQKALKLIESKPNQEKMIKKFVETGKKLFGQRRSMLLFPQQRTKRLARNDNALNVDNLVVPTKGLSYNFSCELYDPSLHSLFITAETFYEICTKVSLLMYKSFCYHKDEEKMEIHSLFNVSILLIVSCSVIFIIFISLSADNETPTENDSIDSKPLLALSNVFMIILLTFSACLTVYLSYFRKVTHGLRLEEKMKLMVDEYLSEINSSVFKRKKNAKINYFYAVVFNSTQKILTFHFDREGNDSVSISKSKTYSYKPNIK